MNFLILAQFTVITLPLGDDATISYVNPMPQSPLGWVTQYKDQTAMGDPYAFRDPYKEVTDRYPTSAPIPRQQVPLEEQMAMNEFHTQQKARQVGIQGAMLNQKINQQQLDYQNSIQNQTKQAIDDGVLGHLDPALPDYEAQKAVLIQKYPLAAQDPNFTRLFQGLDHAHQTAMQSSEILKRQNQDDDEREMYANRRLEENLRSKVAEYGPAAIEAYDKSLTADESGFITPNSHLKAFATASQVINAAKTQAMEDRPMTPQQVRSARLDLIKESNKMLARKADPDQKGTWSPADEANLAAVQAEIDSLNNNPSNMGAKVMPVQSLFPKPSTKTGP